VFVEKYSAQHIVSSANLSEKEIIGIGEIRWNKDF
jgi:hypothetical protein